MSKRTRSGRVTEDPSAATGSSGPTFAKFEEVYPAISVDVLRQHIVGKYHCNKCERDLTGEVRRAHGPRIHRDSDHGATKQGHQARR